MTTNRTSIASVVAALVLVATPIGAGADPVGVVKESGRTAGHSVRNGALTVGRTVRDFFKHGPRTAKRTWERNASHTNDEAHADKERVKQEAHSEK
jgi:hypothetical protein